MPQADPETAFDSDAYLNRIGLGRAPAPDEAGLAELVRAQSYGIPFENFDILLGRGISLAPEDIFEKLVRSPRGGYCFELNGLLLAALRRFGFAARSLLARVHIHDQPTGRTHQVLLVDVAGRPWLADAGFGGGGPLQPLPLELDAVFEHDSLAFRLVASETFGHMLQKKRGDEWQDLYSFDLTHVTDADLEVGNHYTSTHPECFFTFTRVATIPVEGGRVSLDDLTLRRSIGADEEIRELPDAPAYLDALAEHFGIALDAPYRALKPVARRAPG